MTKNPKYCFHTPSEVYIVCRINRFNKSANKNRLYDLIWPCEERPQSNMGASFIGLSFGVIVDSRCETGLFVVQFCYNFQAEKQNKTKTKTKQKNPKNQERTMEKSQCKACCNIKCSRFIENSAIWVLIAIGNLYVEFT